MSVSLGKRLRELGGIAMFTLDCWVIFIDEMALDQLDRKTRFTNTTSTDDHQFILSQKLLAMMVSSYGVQQQG